MPTSRDHKSLVVRILISLSVFANLVLIPLAGYWVYSRGGLKHVTLEAVRGNVAKGPDVVRREFFHIFNSAPLQSHPVVMFGDSLTAAGLWHEWFGLPVLNRGIGGETTSDALLRVSDIAALRPSKVFILLGTNDYGLMSVEQTTRNMDNILSQLSAGSPATEIYLQSLLPPPSLTREEWEQSVNNNYQVLAKERHVHWVDLRTRFADGRVIDRRLTLDGVHLSAEGYRVWSGAITPLIAPQEAVFMPSQPQ